MAAQCHLVVVANGEMGHPERLLAVLEHADGVIAADGGADWLLAQRRPADVLVGDLDSISPQALAWLRERGCRIERHRPDKDETDTELALLEAVRLGARRITLLGALGGRIDHEIANVLLLAMPALEGVEAAIYDGRSWLTLLTREGFVRGAVGDTVSLIPLGGDAEGIVTEGLQYPLRDETLSFGPARGVSNVLTAPQARITLRRGRLLVVHTPQDALEDVHGRS